MTGMELALPVPAGVVAATGVVTMTVVWPRLTVPPLSSK